MTSKLLLLCCPIKMKVLHFNMKHCWPFTALRKIHLRYERHTTVIQLVVEIQMTAAFGTELSEDGESNTWFICTSSSISVHLSSGTHIITAGTASERLEVKPNAVVVEFTPVMANRRTKQRGEMFLLPKRGYF